MRHPSGLEGHPHTVGDSLNYKTRPQLSENKRRTMYIVSTSMPRWSLVMYHLAYVRLIHTRLPATVALARLAGPAGAA
jgi:hypothetical protein